MRRLPTWTVIALALACLLAASGRAAQSAAVREARERAARKPSGTVAVGLKTLAADPAAWLGAQVRFQAQVHSLPEGWSGLLTRFGPAEFLAVRLWADEQRLWVADEYRAPAALVVARRGGPAAETLAEARPYQRFALTGTVEQVLGGRPWIEVTEALRLAEELTEGAILHASRGLQLCEAGEWALAAEELQRALASAPPPQARDELERIRSECLSRSQARAAGRR